MRLQRLSTTPPAELGAQAIAARPGCPSCGGHVALGSPHVVVGRRGVRVFCSAVCMTSTRAPTEHVPVETSRRTLRRTEAFLLVGVGVASLSPCAGPKSPEPPPQVEVAVAAPPTRPAEPPRYGPFLPTRAEAAAEFASSTTGDRWVHPLGGPRRMPARVSRAFGADRPGDRPSECRSGHCGVDLGHTWGEPVHAVHDGVIDRVNRDPRRSGGKYLRIAHRDGTVFTQYFHLAAMPSGLREGQRVALGDVIGVLGDTGVEHSGAHLHFTIAVKPAGVAKMIYIDPEPLIALWPILRADEASAFSPGVPVGAVGSRHRSHRRHRHRARPRKSRARDTAESKRDETPPAQAEVAGDAAPKPASGTSWLPSSALPTGAEREAASGRPAASRALLSVEPAAP